MAALARFWRPTTLIVVYLVLVPAAILYTANQARDGLRNDKRQDAVLKMQISENCKRSYALLDYFVAEAAIKPELRPLISRLIREFSYLDGCPSR